ncbi:hypothetical protein J0H58_08070 [bacterium]|nr:hypothetical protein [bacterium]
MKSFLGASLALVLIPWANWTVLALLVFHGPRIPSALELQHDGLREGMTIEEVRAVLGPETRESTESVFGFRNHDGTIAPVVRGEQVLVWERDGRFVHAGFTGGVLRAKHYFEYDL